VHPIVASCHLVIIAQPLPGAVELILADDGGHRGYGDPLGRIHGRAGPCAAAANRQQGRAALSTRPGWEQNLVTSGLAQDDTEFLSYQFHQEPRKKIA
jgi:hypothetical protein